MSVYAHLNLQCLGANVHLVHLVAIVLLLGPLVPSSDWTVPTAGANVTIPSYSAAGHGVVRTSLLQGDPNRGYQSWLNFFFSYR